MSSVTDFGVTPDRFVKKNISDLLGAIEADERADISPSLNLLATSVLGQLNGIYADKLRELWDVAEAIYRAQYPDSASGEALDGVAAITGAIRLPATKSRVALALTLEPGVTLPVGRVVSIGSTGPRFVTIEAVGNGSNVTADVAVEAEAENFGPIPALPGTIDTIQTPASGWRAVGNPGDAIPGRLVESDADFRVRREALLRISGAATLEVVRSQVLDVEDVVQAFVFENTTLERDAQGLPPKSFEVVACGGAPDNDQAIAEAIFRSKPVGIETYGSISKSVEDSQGFLHPINFSRPIEVNMHIALTVAAEGGVFPLDGTEQIKAALEKLANAQQIGEDVVSLRFACAALGVAGVVDITDFNIGTEPRPRGADNVAIALRELARLDSRNIDVTVNTR